MSDKAISTPRSENTPKYPAVKDKSCPFCHQAFTSSSLGRHLDLYIKPKNPKPPDGIHIVDEIRRIRGNITRRHPRNSTSKNGSSTPAPKHQAPVTDDDGSPTVESPSSLSILNPGKVRPKFNEATWHTTGVINNLPPRPTIAVPDSARSASKHVQQKADFEQRHKATEEWVEAKAAVLALQELVKSIKDASARTAGLGLFDFDPVTLNFPSLCLHILPPPPTLFSPTPFPTSDSWSINPPGQKQFEALLRQVKERITVVNRQRHYQASTSLVPPGYTSPNSPLPTPPLHEVDGSKVLSHVQEAYHHWKTLPEKQKQEAWQLEILRLYVRRGETCKDLENKLEAAEQEAAQLRTSTWEQHGMDPLQYAQVMSKACSAAIPHVSVDTVRELYKQGANVGNWDYERLIEKHRPAAREQRKVSHGMASQRSLSGSSQHTPTATYNAGAGLMNVSMHQPPSAGGASNDVVTTTTMSQPTSATATAFPSAPASDSIMEDDVGDQEDGEGEDEDAEAEDDAEASPQEYKMTTPTQHQHPQHQVHQQQQQQSQQQQQQQQAQQQVQQAQQAQQQQQLRQQQQHHHQQQQVQQQQQQQHQHHHNHQQQQMVQWAQHSMSHHQHTQALAQSQHQHIAQHMSGRAQQAFVDTPVMMSMDGMDASDDSFLDRGMGLGMSSLAESYAQLAGTGGG